jgi:hypothetical protein
MSDLRIQLQTDLRYQDFISRAATHSVLGYKMKVASAEDVLQGKVWAYLDDQLPIFDRATPGLSKRTDRIE